jgi:hypothetical protein
VVINSTIVDDYLDSSPTVEGALKILGILVTIYDKIGLKLAKVTTNSAEVLSSLPLAVKTSKSMKDFTVWSQPEAELNRDTESKLPRMRTLGQQWSMIINFFSYSSYTPDKRIVWNKLYCLSQSAKVYDPLGHASPVLVAAKLVIQRLWKRNAAWLDYLTEEETVEWNQWLENLPLMHLLKFPRALKKGLPETYESIQLHVFADASRVALAAAAYIRILYIDGSVYTNFVMAKSKINSITPEQTIPKLELMAVHTAVLLAKHVADPIKISLEDIYIWTNSKTAIQWLRLPEGTLQVLAHNYCKKIKKGINNLDHVKWVPGPENPVDMPTRPKAVQEVVKIPMWTKGPGFLHLDPSKWLSLPILEKTTDVLEGMKK